MTQGLETRGLRNKVSRALVGVGVGFVAASFADLLGAEAGQQILLWVVAAAVTYAIATPRD